MPDQGVGVATGSGVVTAATFSMRVRSGASTLTVKLANSSRCPRPRRVRLRVHLATAAGMAADGTQAWVSALASRIGVVCAGREFCRCGARQ